VCVVGNGVGDVPFTLLEIGSEEGFKDIVEVDKEVL